MLIGLAYHRVTRRAAAAVPLYVAAPRGTTGDTVDADLDAVIARYKQALDIRRDDLKALLEDTQLLGYQRNRRIFDAATSMSRKLIDCERSHAVACCGLGVVSRAPNQCFACCRRHWWHRWHRHAGRLRAPGDSRSYRVAQIMTRKARVASGDRHLVELIPLFGSTGHHHIPIVDAGGRLVGIITQSDVMAALCEPGPQRA